MLTAEDARKFASQWIRAWNSRNIGQVVSHYAENCQFTSPRAKNVVGMAHIQNRTDLHAYWKEALRERKRVEFRLDYIVWDEAQQRLVIVYWNFGDMGVFRASELIDFDNEGKVIRGESLYGTMVEERLIPPPFE